MSSSIRLPGPSVKEEGVNLGQWVSNNVVSKSQASCQKRQRTRRNSGLVVGRVVNDSQFKREVFQGYAAHLRSGASKTRQLLRRYGQEPAQHDAAGGSRHERCRSVS